MILSRRDACLGLVAGVAMSRSARAAAANADTVLALSRKTAELYHDETLAKRMADALAALATKPDISGLSADQLATRMNAVIEAISSDAHFMVMAGVMGEMRAVPPTEPHQPTPPLNPAELTFLRQRNFGVAAVEVLARNVGRIKIYEQFYRPAPEVRQAIGAAMARLAWTDGLIVDLRRTIGGDPLGVAHFASYFFDRPPFVLNRFRWRTQPAQEFWTSANLEGPRFGERRPVAVLVSRSSFSAAEEFAYDMKVTKRGIVVGERTPGAANHALPVTLPGGFTAFIPQARAENPITGTNWEGVGVAPDIASSPPDVEAARRALIDQI